MSLKEATWEHHKEAERQAFVKEMFGGNITNERYALYLYNQHACYDVLEAIAMAHGIFNDCPELRRAPRIFADYDELKTSPEDPEILKTTADYIEYLKDISHDKDKILAHVYVRHMGDLSGGQMIAKRVPGEGRYYKFDKDVDELKEIVRAKLDDSLADEAKVCFEFATKTFKELGGQ
jgi:heme oxygenase